MPRRKRDYRAEYERRIARAVSKGLTRSQARGHPRAAERHVSPKATGVGRIDRKLLDGLRALRQSRSLGAASRQARVAPERLRRFVRGLDFVEKRKGRYAVGEDPWVRTVPIYTNGQRKRIAVRGYERAVLAGSYWDAVGEFLTTNDPAHLVPFAGVSIEDAKGNTYQFETSPNVLYRVANQGGDTFEQVYRITI